MSKYLICLLLLLIAVPVSAQTATPVPTPGIDLQLDDTNDLLAEGNNMLSGAPADLTRPNGQNILPDVSASREIFGYAKWMLAPSSTQQMFGPIAPIADRAALWIAVVITLGGIYALIYAAIYVISFAIWLFKLINTILQTIAQWIDAINPIG